MDFQILLALSQAGPGRVVEDLNCDVLRTYGRLY